MSSRTSYKFTPLFTLGGLNSEEMNKSFLESDWLNDTSYDVIGVHKVKINAFPRFRLTQNAAK